MQILTVINLIVLLILIAVCYGYRKSEHGSKTLKGKDWTAKKYGSVYVVSIHTQAELVGALNDFAKTAGINLGRVGGIGAVNEATLRFFDPQTKNYVDKAFAGQMEIANLTGNISTKDGQLYTHYHITLGNDNYNALAGHLLDARINGAGEFFVQAVKNGHLERTFNPEIGLNFYDFEK